MKINYDVCIDTFVTVEAEDGLKGAALKPVFEQAWKQFMNQIQSGEINENTLNCFQTLHYGTGDYGKTEEVS